MSLWFIRRPLPRVRESLRLARSVRLRRSRGGASEGGCGSIVWRGLFHDSRRGDSEARGVSFFFTLLVKILHNESSHDSHRITATTQACLGSRQKLAEILHSPEKQYRRKSVLTTTMVETLQYTSCHLVPRLKFKNCMENGLAEVSNPANFSSPCLPPQATFSSSTRVCFRFTLECEATASACLDSHLV